MGGYSSKPTKQKTTQITPIDRAVLDLKVSRDKLQRYRTRLGADTQTLTQKAKDAKANKQTKMALGLLQLRRAKMNQADQVNDQLVTIHTMILTIQNKEEEAQVLEALRAGKGALTKLHQENSIESVLKLMDDIEEQNEVERQINDVLVGMGETLMEGDEEELENELEALMKSAEAASSQVVDTELPVAPVEKLPEIQEPIPSKPVAASSGRVAIAS